MRRKEKIRMRMRKRVRVKKKATVMWEKIIGKAMGL